jgi:hypothetical protein
VSVDPANEKLQPLALLSVTDCKALPAVDAKSVVAVTPESVSPANVGEPAVVSLAMLLQ